MLSAEGLISTYNVRRGQQTKVVSISPLPAISPFPEETAFENFGRLVYPAQLLPNWTGGYYTSGKRPIPEIPQNPKDVAQSLLFRFIHRRSSFNVVGQAWLSDRSNDALIAFLDAAIPAMELLRDKLSTRPPIPPTADDTPWIVLPDLPKADLNPSLSPTTRRHSLPAKTVPVLGESGIQNRMSPKPAAAVLAQKDKQDPVVAGGFLRNLAPSWVLGGKRG